MFHVKYCQIYEINITEIRARCSSESENILQSELIFMAGLDPDEMEEWRTIFNLFDVDGDQTITHEELGIVLRSMGQNPSEQELKEMIR